MVSFLYRTGNGFAGDVNRTASGQTITPEAADPSLPIAAYGVPVAFNTAGTGVRPLAAADTTDDVIGILVRPFPGQAMPPNTYGAGQALSVAAVPPTQGPLSVMRRGFIEVAVNSGSSAAAAKGQPVYAWTAATAVGHTQGGIEATSSPGNTIALPALFRGPVDGSNVTEIEYNL